MTVAIRTAFLVFGLVAIVVALAFWPARDAHPAEMFVSAAFAPPHNEPDILKNSPDVARYAFTLRGEARPLRWLRLDGHARVWGTQPWRNAEKVGSGLAAWGGSDWAVRSAVMEYRLGAHAALGNGWALFTESLSSSGEVPYYHMVGVEKRLW